MKNILLCDGGSPDRVLPLCEKYKLGIEIQGFYNTNNLEITDEIINSYKRILPKDINRYLHAPFWDLSLGSGNKKIVEVTRYYFDYAHDVAEKLGCLGIVVHHGYVPHTSYPPNWIKRAGAFWQDFFLSHSSEIKMFMENHLEQTTEMLQEIVDTCQNDRLFVNLDIGHAYCFSGLPVNDWIEQLGHRIKYVHLHQNNGINDDHMGLRKGKISIKDMLLALEKHAPEAVWALECDLEDMEDSICFLAEAGFLQGPV